jgi:hypothetical protein
LDDLDLAARGEEAEFVQEAGAKVFRELERAEESGVVDRAIVGSAEDFEELCAEVHVWILVLTTEITESHGGGKTRDGRDGFSVGLRVLRGS